MILVGCGDDDSSPRDASRPPDAGRPPDASQPLDASPPFDAGSIDAAAFHCDSFPDSLEPNDTVGTARIPPIHGFVSGRSANWFIDACTSQSNEDWYLFPSDTLGWDRNGSLTDVTMRFYFFAKDAYFCEGVSYCDGERLPSTPENTVTVEVYRASTMELLVAETSEFGVVWLDGLGETFTHDFLIRISGPAEALYDYHMVVTLSDNGSEDECEC